MVKEKEVFRNLPSQLRHHKNSLKVSVYTLKETFLYSSCSTTFAENQMQNFILWLAKVQPDLNSQHCQVPTIKMRALFGKNVIWWVWMRMRGKIQRVPKLSPYILISLFCCIAETSTISVEVASLHLAAATFPTPEVSLFLLMCEGINPDCLRKL